MNDVRVWCIRSLRNDDILEADGLDVDQEFVMATDYATLLARAKELEKVTHITTGDRCGECLSELSYCGEMTSDGPSLDCRHCQLVGRVKELEAALAAKETP